jgi:hypothetical protein
MEARRWPSADIVDFGAQLLGEVYTETGPINCDEEKVHSSTFFISFGGACAIR